jgi:uncharacterized protein DUF6916
VAGLEWVTYDAFAPLVGEGFDVSEPELGLVLFDAAQGTEPGGAGPEGQTRMQFSLYFRGPSGPVLPQGTYELTNAALGELAVFLVPIGPDEQGMVYEAAFA